MNYKLYEKYGMLGFLGGVLMFAANLFAIHAPDHLLGSVVQTSWNNIPYWRFIVSALMGCGAIILFILGFYSLHMMIEETVSSKVIEIIATAAIFGVASVGVIHFMSMCILPISYKSALEAGISPEAASLMVENVEHHLKYIDLILTAFCDIEGVIIIYLVLSRKAGLPLWTVILNPFTVMILVELLSKFISAPYSGSFFESLESFGEGLTYLVTYMYFRKEQRESEILQNN